MEADSVDNSGMVLAEPGSVKEEKNLRVEIDTSAPFESVKEAVTRFGGVGFWKPTWNTMSDPEDIQELDTKNLQEQATALEKELILKKNETLDILKELESTKRLIEDLKSKIQKEQEFEEAHLKNIEEDKENSNQLNQLHVLQTSKHESRSKPDVILMQLKQAKLNLTKTTNDLADVRACVVSLKKKLEKEKVSLKKTQEKLALSSLKLCYLKDELNQTRMKLQEAKDDNPSDHITKELERLSLEAEHFRIIEEAAKSEVSRTLSEIEQTRTMVRTAELRLVAARKMKEAARAAESAYLAEINVLCSTLNCSSEVVTISLEEYNALTSKAQEAEEDSKRRVLDAMDQADEANLSRMEIMKRVEEATGEDEICKEALEEAMERVEAANRGKGHKRRPSSVLNSTKFKNSYSSHRRRGSLLDDVNMVNLLVDDDGGGGGDEDKPDVLKPVLSIGQILRRKLLLSQDFEAGSLGYMLGKQKHDFPGNRGKFGFGRLSHLLGKQQKKKKKTTLNLR